MSGALEANTAAVIALGEIMSTHNALLREMMDKKGGTAPATGSATVAAEKTTGAKPPKPSKVDKVTLATLRAAIGEWLGASAKGSPEEKAKKESLKKILEAVGAAKVPEIAEDKVMEAHNYFVAIKNGEDPFPEEEEAAEEDESLL